MQQIFVKDTKDSMFNMDVLAKLKNEHIPLQTAVKETSIFADDITIKEV